MAFDADAFIESLNRRGITPVIPPKSTRNVPRACDFTLRCERNLVVLAGVQLVSTIILLN
jgi:hypothetical protein